MCQQARISIHALREEGDVIESELGTGQVHFYPRPPRGGRPSGPYPTLQPGEFLSTPSARRATRCRCRPVRPTAISIHALREEGDGFPDVVGQQVGHFYPRPPRGGRPTCIDPLAAQISISIHALREEGDLPALHHIRCPGYFYPRPPRGGRL